jgi:hypothetical protein
MEFAGEKGESYVFISTLLSQLCLILFKKQFFVNLDNNVFVLITFS